MKWMKFTLDTRVEAVDLISGMLSDLGINGIEIEDNLPLTEDDKKQMFVDILPNYDKNDKSAKINFYVEPSENTGTLIDRIREELKEISSFISVGSGRITFTEIEDRDWLNEWKKFFKPFRLDDTIVIKPTWEKLTSIEKNDLVIEMDPGISFGTGSHETTKLCIKAIKKHLKPGSIVLDVGSGSGILSILANKLGADKVLGIDIDPLATKTSIENSKVNNISSSQWLLENNQDMPDTDLVFATGNILEDYGIGTYLNYKEYDLIVANILADVIIPMSELIGENMKKGALFISSGIIDTKEEEVKSSLENSQFTILEVNRMGDWVSFIAQK